MAYSSSNNNSGYSSSKSPASSGYSSGYTSTGTTSYSSSGSHHNQPYQANTTSYSRHNMFQPGYTETTTYENPKPCFCKII